MIATLSELLSPARGRGYAVGAFNTYNLETTKAILGAAEARSAPVIIQIGMGAIRYGGWEALSALALAQARRSAVRVAVHLDHATQLGEIAFAMDLGYTSAMIDGSALPFVENVALTRQAVSLAHSGGVSLEAELGSIVGEEDRASEHDSAGGLTDPERAEEFVRETGVDALAVAVGNVHGFYRGAPHLDLARLGEIQRRVGVPLVLHGASGLAEDTIRHAIRLGVCKFNVNTEIRVALFSAIPDALANAHDGYDIPRLFTPAIQAMQRVIETKMELFGCAGQSSLVQDRSTDPN